MRICPVCGDVYDARVAVCAVDGAHLSPWETWAIPPEFSVVARLARADTAERSIDFDDAETRIADPCPTVPPLPLAPTPGGSLEGDAGLGRLLVDRYELRRQIGVGGFGAVFEAEDRHLKKRIAIKVLSPQLAHNPEAIERFRREAVAAGQIGHEGIVDVTDFDQTDDGAYFIAMEYLDGTDLAHVLEREGALHPARALRIAAQIAYALAAAHRKGIAHRDLKPANIYLTTRDLGDDYVKIIDFGISKVLAQRKSMPSLTAPGKILGTPHYMSPEQAQGDGSVDGRSDVYALGVILYEMLAGRPPFEGRDYMDVVHKHVADAALPPTEACPRMDLPPAVDPLVLRALAKEPAERYPSMADFGDAIVTLLGALDPVAAAVFGPARRRTASPYPDPLESTLDHGSAELTVSRAGRPSWQPVAIAAAFALGLIAIAGGAYVAADRLAAASGPSKADDRCPLPRPIRGLCPAIPAPLWAAGSAGTSLPSPHRGEDEGGGPQ